MASVLDARGPKNFFFAFSTLLDDLAPILAIFLLKMQKSQKSAQPTVVFTVYTVTGVPNI
jgi:hypothetical protein